MKKKDTNSDLQKFVDRIADYFETHQLLAAKMSLSQGGQRHPECKLSGYHLNQAHPKNISSQTDANKTSHIYTPYAVNLDDPETQDIFKHATAGVHKLTLKQDLHFDAFKKLLLEKGLVVKRVIDWKLHATNLELKKIKEWGQSYSAVEKSPLFSHTVCIITRKSKNE